MPPEKLTPSERRAIVSLSSIMGLRMVGLFMVLPVFALYAQHLNGATATLVGLALGIYGLTQALFQIPFGSLSDRFGRKPIILTGLILFAVGSLIAAIAHSIIFMIIGRALQGTGAVGSTILATMADLTRENQRTKAMAIAGMTIGFSFALAMLIGPLLTLWLPINSLFLLAVLFSFVAILILFTNIPEPPSPTWHRDTEPELKSFIKLLKNSELAKLNCGIFILHAIFTASFIAIPISLHTYAGLQTNQQWLLYLPTLLIAFVVTLFCIGMAERKRQLKPYFLGGIITLPIAELLLWLAPQTKYLAAMGLCLFFAGFSLLEAFLPSLVSRTAPAARKGTALGIYSCSQFSGIFVGGLLGGWLYGHLGLTGVYLLCILLSCFWLVLALLMQPPRNLTTYLLKFLSTDARESITTRLQKIPGIIEVTLIAEESIAYLKMEKETVTHPDFIRLKEELQSDL